MTAFDTADSKGHSPTAKTAGMKTAGIGVLGNSISINAGFKAGLDIAVSVSSLSCKREVLRLSPWRTQGLATQSIHESPLCFWSRLSCGCLQQALRIRLHKISILFLVYKEKKDQNHNYVLKNNQLFCKNTKIVCLHDSITVLGWQFS